MFKAKVHPDFNGAKINVFEGAGISGAILNPVERGYLRSSCGKVSVFMDAADEDELPSRVHKVLYLGRETSAYSIVPNGKRKKGRFART